MLSSALLHSFAVRVFSLFRSTHSFWLFAICDNNCVDRWVGAKWMPVERKYIYRIWFSGQIDRVHFLHEMTRWQKAETPHLDDAAPARQSVNDVSRNVGCIGIFGWERARTHNAHHTLHSIDRTTDRAENVISFVCDCGVWVRAKPHSTQINMVLHNLNVRRRFMDWNKFNWWESYRIAQRIASHRIASHRRQATNMNRRVPSALYFSVRIFCRPCTASTLPH